MRGVILLIALFVLLMESGGRVKPVTTIAAVAKEASTTSTPSGRVDFDTQIKPILQSKCMPCHFSGGQMYERLPFDRSETIRKLGTRMFTRITKEDERHLLEQFLKQSP